VKDPLWVLDLSGAETPSPSGFFFLNKQVLLWVVGCGVFHDNWRTNFGLAQTTEPPGHKPLVVNVVALGPFEEEEEGIGLASDVGKAEGEDPDTPVYQRGDRLRLGHRRSWIVGASPLARSRSSPGTVHNDSPISV